VTEAAYFITVDWCNKGGYGIFCDSTGKGYRREDRPYTELEMQTILGPFWLILGPRSELLTETQVATYNQWTPLAEYSNAFGIARQKQD